MEHLLFASISKLENKRSTSGIRLSFSHFQRENRLQPIWYKFQPLFNSQSKSIEKLEDVFKYYLLWPNKID